MKLTVALPKGRLGQTAWEYLFSPWAFPFDERKLSVENESVRVLWVKPIDVIAYVKMGAADIGITGLDSLQETGSNLYQLQRLPFGYCKLVAARLKSDTPASLEKLKVATKYPNLANNYYQSISQAIDIITLQGSVELAPVIGLADVIVDIVETGSTLKANGLQVDSEIMESQAMLVANHARYRFHQKAIQALIKTRSNAYAKTD